MPRRDLTKHADDLSRKLGVTLAPTARLDEALTHPSASTPSRPDNQRLEFLGDRVLNLVLAEALFERLPDAAEGDLAPRYNALVRKEACAEVAAEIGLGRMMRLGRSEHMTGGQRKATMLADAMEALIAAIYLDHGMESVRQVILGLWRAKLDEDSNAAPLDPKSDLQKWAQARGLNPPRYVTLGRSGSDHAPTFTIAARLEDGREAEASAPSKRAAQQAAAAELLARLEREND